MRHTGTRANPVLSYDASQGHRALQTCDRRKNVSSRWSRTSTRLVLVSGHPHYSSIGRWQASASARRRVITPHIDSPLSTWIMLLAMARILFDAGTSAVG